MHAQSAAIAGHPAWAGDCEIIRVGIPAAARGVSGPFGFETQPRWGSEKHALFAVFRVTKAAAIPSIPIWPTSNQELFSDFR